jgi:glycosyltransferase involved in cell wall biosynthesis
LWVGDLTTNKDPLLTVNAFSKFLKHTPDAQFWMIYSEKKLEQELRDCIALNNVQSSIHLVGRVSHQDLIYWYNSADFIISASHYEGSGIAVCEAMSCGCIPIVTDIPSFRMMTDNERIGLIYPVGNEEVLLQQLQLSISLNRSEEKKKVLDRFFKELSFDANARKIWEVITEPESH